MSAIDDVRQWHYLRPVKSTSIPRRLIFADTETTPRDIGDINNTKIHEFRLACATFGRYEKGKLTRKASFTFGRIEYFWKEVANYTEKRQTTWLFIHNAGFDLTVLRFWELIEDGTIDIGICFSSTFPSGSETSYRCGNRHPYLVLNDPPTIISCKINGNQLMIVDSLNYFAQPLSALGERVNIPKLPMPAFNAPDDVWAKYCRNDVDILAASIIELIHLWEVNDMGPWGPTAASLSMATYRRRHLREQEILVHGNKEALTIERFAYFGGQTIANYIGHIGEPCALLRDSIWLAPDHYPTLPCPIHVLDVTSLYPHVMAECPMPTEFVGCHYEHNDGTLFELAKDYCIIAMVEINSPNECYPVKLSTRIEQSMLIGSSVPIDIHPYQPMVTGYRRGKFTTVLAWPELHHAMRASHVSKVHRVALYKRGNPFKTFVYEMFAKKFCNQRCGNAVYAHLYKTILNSLAGKFAQRRGLWIDSTTEPATKPWGSWPIHNADTGITNIYRSIAWHCQVQTERGETNDSCPAIAAYITSAARELMRQYRGIAGERNWYYQDTDSLHVNDTGLHNLSKAGCIENDRLGKLRHVSSHAKARYCGLKHYSLDGQWVIGGVRATAVEITPTHWHQEEWERIPGIINGKPPAGVRVYQKCSLRSVRHPAGDIGDDGWVTPWSLG